MKRCAVLLALLVLLATLPALGEFLVTEDESEGGSPLSVLSKDPALAEAQRKLLAGDLVAALNAFATLGNSAAAPQYTAYAKALLSYERNDLAAAKAGFAALGGFLDSAWQAKRASALRLHRFAENGKFGYIGPAGEWAIQPAYDWAERVFRAASAAPRDEAGDGDSLLTVAAVFAGETVCDGTDIVPVSGKYGLLRSDGELAAPVAFDEILWTESGFAALRTGGEYALYDLLARAPVGGPYEAIGGYGEGRVAVRQNGLWAYVDRAGQTLGEDWTEAMPFREGYAAVRTQGGLMGFVDADGEMVIDAKYDELAPFSEGYAAFRTTGKRWGFLDTTGDIVLEAAYQEVGAFSQGRCAVKRNGKWGVIDPTGAWIVKTRYDEITAFDPIYHRAWMRNNKLWGLLSQDGKVVLKPSWSSRSDFGAEGLARVGYKNRYGYVDSMGVTRIQNLYPAAAEFSSGYGAVRDEGGQVRYLTKLGRGFTLESDVPTACLCGFLEARKITATETVATDAAGAELVTVSYAAEYAVYDLDGQKLR